MLMKRNVLFNRSNSLQISEAKHTNGRAAKFSFLDHEEPFWGRYFLRWSSCAARLPVHGFLLHYKKVGGRRNVFIERCGCCWSLRCEKVCGLKWAFVCHPFSDPGGLHGAWNLVSRNEWKVSAFFTFSLCMCIYCGWWNGEACSIHGDDWACIGCVTCDTSEGRPRFI